MIDELTAAAAALEKANAALQEAARLDDFAESAFDSYGSQMLRTARTLRERAQVWGDEEYEGRTD